MGRPASSKPFIALKAASAPRTSTYSKKQKPLCLPVDLSCDMSTSFNGPKFAKIALLMVGWVRSRVQTLWLVDTIWLSN